MPTITDEPKEVQKLQQFIDDINIAMLTTVNPEDGSLHSRPMQPIQGMEEDETIWFFARENSAKVEEAKSHPQASVTFTAPQKQHYVSLSGTIEIVTDREEIEKRWNPSYKSWFPEGKDSPDLALIHFTPHRGEYWDGEANPIVLGIKMATAALTGTMPDAGDNKEVILSRN